MFVLNLYIQSVGYYVQWIIQTGSHTDAFEQLGPSHGAEDRERFVSDEWETNDGPAGWMDAWTIFYWGWWVSWSPFVGMFIAKISRGRTVKSFIAGTMLAPVLYVFLWMTIFGGTGIRMEREAAGSGLCCHNLNMTQIEAVMGDTTVSISDQFCAGGKCNDCTLSLLAAQNLSSVTELKAEMSGFTKADWWGTTTQDRSLTRLSCRATEEMWFDMMMSYRDIGGFLSGFSILSLILYFVTSSDSGSLVIDCLASNGHPEPPRLQRLLWALLGKIGI